MKGTFNLFERDFGDNVYNLLSFSNNNKKSGLHIGGSCLGEMIDKIKDSFQAKS